MGLVGKGPLIILLVSKEATAVSRFPCSAYCTLLPYSIILFWCSPPAGKDSRCDNVSQCRHALTMVTSLWGSGECGPLCLVIPDGFLTGDQQAELQKKYEGDVYLISTGRSSHFMNADTVVTYFDTVLADAFERRRGVLAERHGRDFQNEWGAILCDSFTGHHAQNGGTDLQRHSAWYYGIM